MIREDQGFILQIATKISCFTYGEVLVSVSRIIRLSTKNIPDYRILYSICFKINSLLLTYLISRNVKN